MAANITIKDGLGASQVIRTTDDGSLNHIPLHRLTDATGVNFSPTMDAVARPGFQKITDGTNTMPTMDVAARKGFVIVTDGTSSITVKAASTAAVAGDTGLVVALHPTSPVTTNADATLTAGTAPAKAFVLAGQFLSNATLPAATTAQTVALQTDPAGTQKVGLAVLGTPIYNGANAGATQNVATLTIPAAKMGFLDGFDLDGLGATAGSAIALTMVGLLGGTLTIQVGIPAGATVPFHQSFRFNPPLQASAVATNIVVTAPSYGTGNTAASINAYGHYL